MWRHFPSNKAAAVRIRWPEPLAPVSPDSSTYNRYMDEKGVGEKENGWVPLGAANGPTTALPTVIQS